MCKTQKKNLQTAFTLIEVLAVVCVVAVLAALLFPGVTSLIDASKKAKCVGNLKALGGALSAYQADTGLIFDRSPHVKVAGGFLHQFPLGDGEPSAQLFSYLNDPKVFFCPANNQSRSAEKEFKAGQWVFATYLYCFDTYGSNGNWSSHGLSAPRRFDPRGVNAARTPMMTDMVSTQDGTTIYVANHLKSKTLPPKSFNVLFVDGHVSDCGVPTELFWGSNPGFFWPKDLLEDVKRIQQN